MNNRIFLNNNFYHIYNRGVDKRVIFQNQKDHYRFIHDLYEFNNKNPVLNYIQPMRKNINIENPTSKKRKLLVDIMCFCLMPNHFHLILRQKVENGITEFMRKLGTGYTNYFNTEYQRSGVLFQGRFKAIDIQKDEYLMHLSRYIHLNPIELIENNWKKNGIKNYKKINDFLENYRWSSYLDFIDKKNFPSIINNDFLMSYFKGGKDYKKFIFELILNDFEKINNIILE
ncbi:MAG: transposase [Patescibacteria group bacterium]